MTDNGVAYKGSAQAGSYQEEHAVLTAYTLQPAASPARDAGLFDCFADMETCCLGYFCPCLLFGQSLRRARLTKTTRAGCGIYMLPSMVISILTFFLVYGLFSNPAFQALVDSRCYCNTTNTTNATAGPSDTIMVGGSPATAWQEPTLVGFAPTNNHIGGGDYHETFAVVGASEAAAYEVTDGVTADGHAGVHHASFGIETQGLPETSTISTADVNTNGVNDLYAQHVQLPDEIVRFIADGPYGFTFFDADGDGKVNADELGAGMRALGQQPTDAEARSIVAAADADGSGAIERPGFIAMLHDGGAPPTWPSTAGGSTGGGGGGSPAPPSPEEDPIWGDDKDELPAPTEAEAATATIEHTLMDDFEEVMAGTACDKAKDPLCEYCTDSDGGALPGGGCPDGHHCDCVVVGQGSACFCAPPEEENRGGRRLDDNPTLVTFVTDLRNANPEAALAFVRRAAASWCVLCEQNNGDGNVSNNVGEGNGNDVHAFNGNWGGRRLEGTGEEDPDDVDADAASAAARGPGYHHDAGDGLPVDYCAEPRPAHCGKNADEVVSRFVGLYFVFFFKTYALGLAGALAIFVLCAYYRQRLYAALYGKPAEGGCGSCLLHCCCHRCALCQEARAAKHATYQAQTAAYVGLIGADCQHMDREVSQAV